MRLPRRLVVLSAVVALVAYCPAFWGRLTRNIFTPAIPRSVEPRYPLVDESILAQEVTVVAHGSCAHQAKEGRFWRQLSAIRPQERRCS